jgi:RNA polymerase sigma-70 factor (ECF subfamily)
MAPHDPDTYALIERAGRADDAARRQLLAQHRKRLRRMVALRLDRRLAARIDRSDVVQGALVEAARRWPGHLRDCLLPSYPGLWRIAWELLIKLQRRHLYTRKRSARREQPQAFYLGDNSARHLRALERLRVQLGEEPGEEER